MRPHQSMLIRFLLYFSIKVHRIFNRKFYYFRQLGGVYFIVNRNYDNTLKDYYEYVEKLLSSPIHKISRKCLVLLDCNGFAWLKLYLPVLKIALQVEHTLVKSGARDSNDAIAGHVPILGSPENYLVRITNLLKLQSAHLVIEYSQVNQCNVKRSPDFAEYSSKSLCISPALYPLDEKVFSLAHVRNVDTITLFGNPDEPRRRKFLRSLESKSVKSQNINNIYQGIENFYRDTKILINIRQTDHHDTLEELRILPALRCGVLVISELAPLIDKVAYSKYIIWGELDELPQLILEVQNNYQKWHSMIFNGSEFMTRMLRISLRNELIAQRATNILNKSLPLCANQEVM